MNRKGELLKVFDTKVGLKDQTILAMGLDEWGDLWLAMCDGITHIDLTSGYTYIGENQDKGIRFRNNLLNYDQHSRWFVHDGENRIWVTEEFSGIYSLSLSNDKDSIESQKFYDEKNGLPTAEFNYVFNLKANGKDKMLVATSKGIYSYDQIRLFMFTDGFSDQFGGSRNQKFMIVRFRKLILSTSELDIDAQYNELLKSFYEWKGDESQIDDICIMGLKF